MPTRSRPQGALTPDVTESPSGAAVNSPMSMVIGSFKHGGTIKKTGNYKLHAGEEVVAADKAGTVKDLIKKAEGAISKDEKARGSKKHKFSRTEIDHHGDGSHTVRHRPDPSKDKTDGSGGDDITYAASDNADLQTKLGDKLDGASDGDADDKEAPPADDAQDA